MGPLVAHPGLLWSRLIEGEFLISKKEMEKDKPTSKSDANSEPIASKPLLEEASSSEFFKLMQSYPCGIISAYHGKDNASFQSRKIDKYRKTKGQRQLWIQLQELGYSVIEGYSRYLEGDRLQGEETIFVYDRSGVGDLENQLRSLASRFHQEVFLYTNLQEQLFCLEGLLDCSRVFVKKGEVLQTPIQKTLWAVEGDMFATEIGRRLFFYDFAALHKLPISGEECKARGYHAVPWLEKRKAERLEIYEMITKEYAAREASGWSQ